MLHLIAHFQYAENYGSRWKFKGGDAVVLCPLAIHECTRGQDYLSSLVDTYVAQRGLAYSNSESSNTLIDWEIADDLEHCAEADVDRLCFGPDATHEYRDSLVLADGTRRYRISKLQNREPRSMKNGR